MKKNLALLILLTLSSPLARAEEVKLAGPEITALLADQFFVGADEGSQTEQLFQKGGLTLYTDRGAQSQGQWKVDGDQYCSVWPPSAHWSCYDVLKDGGNVAFVSASGSRSIFRKKTP